MLDGKGWEGAGCVLNRLYWHFIHSYQTKRNHWNRQTGWRHEAGGLPEDRRGLTLPPSFLQPFSPASAQRWSDGASWWPKLRGNDDSGVFFFLQQRSSTLQHLLLSQPLPPLLSSFSPSLRPVINPHGSHSQRSAAHTTVGARDRRLKPRQPDSILNPAGSSPCWRWLRVCVCDLLCDDVTWCFFTNLWCHSSLMFWSFLSVIWITELDWFLLDPPVWSQLREPGEFLYM